MSKQSSDTEPLFPPWLVLLGFLTLVVGAGAFLGITTAPGAWYDGLNKPALNPPDWVFSPVWLVLYILVALAGYRTWRRAPRSRTMLVWWAQLLVNWSWPVAFFEFRLFWTALALILVMIALTAGFIISAYRGDDRPAAWLLVPYLGWIAFAAYLSAGIAALN